MLSNLQSELNFYGDWANWSMMRAAVVLVHEFSLALIVSAKIMSN